MANVLRRAVTALIAAFAALALAPRTSLPPRRRRSSPCSPGLAQWYGVSHEPDTGAMGSMRHLERLSGPEFEIAFLSMMIRHHWGAVRESAQCLRRAFHPDLLDMCQGIIEARLAEIEQMQTWLHDWYGRHAGRPLAQGGASSQPPLHAA